MGEARRPRAGARERAVATRRGRTRGAGSEGLEADLLRAEPAGRGADAAALVAAHVAGRAGVRTARDAFAAAALVAVVGHALAGRIRVVALDAEHRADAAAAISLQGAILRAELVG